MKFSSDIQVAQRMNPSNFRDPLSFPLVPQAGQTFHLSSETAFHRSNLVIV